ncbi:hypothetical protein PG997_005553 [Apiospora hydei]|uniref:N-acetyltransferase domain-containing protein n=1 Tax=Apiospora hydei TaxID=1337664 RepID=A0ABR1WLB4_9PEZI
MTIGGPSPMTVIFSEASTQHHRLQCCKLAATAFGPPLSEQDYLEREAYLDQQPLTQHGGWRTWCLRTTAEPPGQVVSACKTIQRSLLVRESGTVSERKGYCIASVVTHPDFRGRGTCVGASSESRALVGWPRRCVRQHAVYQHWKRRHHQIL